MSTPDTTAWCEKLVLELRLRGVKGSRIGDEVASVEAYCAESGESAVDAFGDPREYAAALAFDPDDVDDDVSTASLLVGAWPAFLGLAGFYVASWAAAGLHTGGAVPIGLGQVVGVILVVAAIAVIVRFLGTVLRHVAVFAVVFVVTIALAIAAARFLDITLFTAPFPVVVGVAVVLLAGSVVAHYRLRGTDDDPVVDPVEGRDRYASKHPRAARAGVALGPWFWVFASVAIFVFTAVVPG